MIKINRDKRAIQIGELVIVKKWTPKKGYTYSERIGIVMADEGVDENGQERWGRWHVALEDGDYIGCYSSEIEVIQEVSNVYSGSGTVDQIN
mgnify:CR=1 FL=1|tara:strand:+ start:678 stop:953 length:276 start_codon:yes stop_codon:yes gene_type:complete